MLKSGVAGKGAYRSPGENLQMTWRLETAPVGSKYAMSQARGVGRRRDKPAAGPKYPPRLAQKLFWIMNMLENMVADDRVENSIRVILLNQGSATNLQTTDSGVGDCRRIGLKSLSFPSEFA
jgi:hypothetical protein